MVLFLEFYYEWKGKCLQSKLPVYVLGLAILLGWGKLLAFLKLFGLALVFRGRLGLL